MVGDLGHRAHISTRRLDKSTHLVSPHSFKQTSIIKMADAKPVGKKCMPFIGVDSRYCELTKSKSNAFAHTMHPPVAQLQRSPPSPRPPSLKQVSAKTGSNFAL